MGNAGSVDFPSYMKDVHNDWLDKTGTVTITAATSLNNRINSASNPYTSQSSYDPATAVGAMATALTTFTSTVNALSATGEWETAMTLVNTKFDELWSDDYIQNLTQEFGEELDDQIDLIVVPKFEASMRDVGAVLTSSFDMGKAVIYGMRNRDVAKFQAELFHKREIQKLEFVGKSAEKILSDRLVVAEIKKLLLHYTMEVNRLKIVAEKEELDGQLAIEVGEQKWPFEVFQMAANVLGAIGGGTAVYDNTPKSPSTAQSALAGALAGAALGAQVGGQGNWTSIGAGALLGGILGGVS